MRRCSNALLAISQLDLRRPLSHGSAKFQMSRGYGAFADDPPPRRSLLTDALYDGEDAGRAADTRPGAGSGGGSISPSCRPDSLTHRRSAGARANEAGAPEWHRGIHVRRRGSGGEKLAVSLLTSHQGEPGSIPGRMMPLTGGFSRGSPVSPALSFWCCSILASNTLTGSQDLAVKSGPDLVTPRYTHTPYLRLEHRTPSCHPGPSFLEPSRMSEEIWAARNSEVLRAEEGDRGIEGRKKREIPEKTRRPPVSSSTIPTCENLVTRPGIEPGSPCWGASVLTVQPHGARTQCDGRNQGRVSRKITSLRANGLCQRALANYLKLADSGCEVNSAGRAGSVRKQNNRRFEMASMAKHLINTTSPSPRPTGNKTTVQRCVESKAQNELFTTTQSRLAFSEALWPTLQIGDLATPWSRHEAHCPLCPVKSRELVYTCVMDKC
ncbi:hypothetical protein PR048_004741 [Dryococelus australis]|uniref:Uncharacterized protein n=1 Tax=Dryococelus australis TaxID=614101 RepID=A0ABQ9I720_9NEOP|nr:hypothetical protein PR048_004741 [Dryococelus australis]